MYLDRWKALLSALTFEFLIVYNKRWPHTHCFYLSVICFVSSCIQNSSVFITFIYFVDLDSLDHWKITRSAKRKRISEKSYSRLLVNVPKDNPLDPFGLPTSMEVSDKLMQIFRELKKFNLRCHGKIFRFAFVSHCCRVNHGKRKWTCEL